MLPNFLCIGAQKAGTTTIAQMLERHPGVFMAEPRETRFFVDEVRFAFGVQNYEMTCFGGWNAEPAVGEKTPEYLLFDETPARVRAVLGEEVRLIVCLRDPARRAFSQFRHNLMQRVETLPFAAALECEADRIKRNAVHTALFGYRHRGRFARRLRPWLAQFPRACMLLLKFESDIAGPDAAHLPARLFRFLDLPDLPDCAIPRAGRPDPTRWRVGADMVEAKSGNATFRVRAPSGFLRAFAREAEAALPAAEALTAIEARALNARYWHDDITALAALTGLDFQDWLG